MYRKLYFLVCFILLLSMVSYTSAQEADAEFPSTVTPPNIDGVMENIWTFTEEHEVENEVAGSSDNAGCSGSWWALWDAENLYIFVDVNDDDLQNDSGSNWEDDSVEVFFDGGNDKPSSYGDDDYQFFLEAQKCHSILCFRLAP